LIISISIDKFSVKKQKPPTFAVGICDLRARKIKKKFFTQINTPIDWDAIFILINKDYSKGKVTITSLLMMGYGFLKGVFYQVHID
jgi:hypothetical protein